jgi:hypothetical protein
VEERVTELDAGGIETRGERLDRLAGPRLALPRHGQRRLQ